MAVTPTHPQYDRWQPDWVIMDDTYEGQRHIKGQRTIYLPAIPSMHLDGMGEGQVGRIRYDAYLLRAVFPDDTAEAVRNYIGLLHQKPPVITVPPEMEPMLTKCTSDGESVEALLRRINEMQLRHGRVGIMLDLPSNASLTSLPYIALYRAKSILNWDDGKDELDSLNLNMVILDESRYERGTDFSWTWKEKYRLLQLGKLATDEVEGTATYTQGLFDSGQTPEGFPDKMMRPVYRGSPLTAIPFQFINTTDITAEPEAPPLLGLANLCLTIYRGEADYRQTLFLQSQDTLVVIGGTAADAQGADAPLRVGAGARIDVGINGDAKYIGVTSDGLSEQRVSLETDRAEAQLKSGQLISTKQSSQESGEAMKTRIAARTASLIRIAYTGAAGLENLLKQCALWMGADPEKVSVKPNLEFAKNVVNGQDFVQIVTARNLGAPISQESVHNWCSDQGLTTMSFADETAKIKVEQKDYPLPKDPKADLNSGQQDPTNKPAPKDNDLP